MKLKRKYSALAIMLVIIMTFASSINAFAISASDIDMDQKGSINVSFDFIEDTVITGELTLFKVADIKLKNGDIRYVYTKEFADCEEDLDGLMDNTFAENLKYYAEENGIEGKTKRLDSKSSVSFKNLDLGIYLVVQNEATKGYYEISPFVVSIPNEIDGEISYDVDATPKTEISFDETETETEAPETESIEETTTKKEKTTKAENATIEKTTDVKSVSKIVEQKIPQTGLLVWPIILLVLTGVLMIGSGVMVKGGKTEDKRNEDEA